MTSPKAGGRPIRSVSPTRGRAGLLVGRIVVLSRTDIAVCDAAGGVRVGYPIQSAVNFRGGAVPPVGGTFWVCRAKFISSLKTGAATSPP
ncbi:hypothetical protein GCM10010468_66970 [Actinocorallia longicatena]|uniref:Uncharacterized protein n=1 Tax=Actinocorallia longicatena TaxID=111803 RepID=A0ABP6QIU2_9ACTN